MRTNGIKTVLVADALPDLKLVDWSQVGARMVYAPGITREDPGAVTRSDIVVVRTSKITSSMLDSADRLKLIIRAGAGVDNIDVAAAKANGVMVANTPGCNAAAVAELTIGLLVAADRDVVNGCQSLRNGVWCRSSLPKARGLSGRTLGILGVGNVGMRVASIASAMGMSVVGWSPSLTEDRASACGLTLATTPLQVAEVSDAVSLHLALAGATRHLVNARFLSVMKEGAILVNTARGGLINTADLKHYIHAKSLRVALDVFEDEPLTECSAFTDRQLASEVTATPHIAAITAQSLQAMTESVAECVRRFVAGDTLSNLISSAAQPRT